MNKRIRELAEQAGYVEFEYNPHDLDKFAELLIKECLKVINQPNGVGDDDVIRISNDVKEHFGIKK